MNIRIVVVLAIVVVLLLLWSRTGGAPRRQHPDSTSIDLANASPGTVVLSNGYETNPQDGGRPVVLIAAALGVKEQVFRDAFRNVQPSRLGPPTPMRAHANKKVLMDALSKYGVTNDRLDEVSNYYRYRPQDGEIWTSRPAEVTAVIRDGKVTGFTITDPGAGYSSVPKLTVAGHPNVQVVATIKFSQTLLANGRLAELTVIEAE